MKFFRNEQVTSIDKVRQHLYLLQSDREIYDVRLTAPFYNVVTPAGTDVTFFENSKTLVGQNNKLASNRIGAVVLRKELPELENNQKIDVMLHTDRSCEYKGYGVVSIDSETISTAAYDQGREAVVHEAAALAVYKYLDGEAPITRFSQPARHYLTHAL